MGKYMKKPKFTSFNVLPMVSSTVGVCTRAKSICLQTSASSSDDDSSSYLELRSRRRLKKVFSISQGDQVQKPISQLIINSSPSARSSPFRTPASSRQRNSVTIGLNKPSSGNKVAARGNHFNVEASIGDDNLNFLTNERVTRGSTYSHEANNMSTDMPSFRELEAFFAAAELQQQRKFMDKYNFDIVAEKPLPGGRYDWFRISH